MNPTNQQSCQEPLQWGECICSLCSGIFKADQSAVRFFHRYYRDAALFMLCPDCAAKYDHCTPTERSRMQDECFRAIEACTGSRSQLGCTTYSAVLINGGDYCAAVENGTCGLDRASYELLARSDRATLFVNGMPVHWEGLPEFPNPVTDPTNGRDQHQL
jgi:hypothetical protein